jgi:hypothetical protein
MPGQEYPDDTQEGSDSPFAQMAQASLSRRSLLRRSAMVGAVGLAVAAGGGGAVAAVVSSQSKGAAGAQLTSDAASTGPIVVYLADPRSGEMEIFAGTGSTHHRDPAVASLMASMAPR